MPRVSLPFNSLNGGEFGTSMRARTDLDRYKSSVETMENFLPRVQGGAERRVGTRYVAESTETDKPTPLDKKSRLIPFIFNEDQAYILEFSEGIVRFNRNEAPIHPDRRLLTTGSTSRNEFLFTNGHYLTHLQGPFRLVPDTLGDYPTDIATNDIDYDIWVVLPQTFTFNDMAELQDHPTGVPADTILKAHKWTGAHGPFNVSTDGELPDDGTQGLDTNDEQWILGAPAPGAFQLSRTQTAQSVIEFGEKSNGGAGTTTYTHSLVPTAAYKRTVLQFASDAAGTNIVDLDVNAAGAVYIEEKELADTTATFPRLPLQLETPYLESELFELDYTQSADVLYITHKNHPPAKISRTAHTEWTYDVLDLVDGPYLGIREDFDFPDIATTTDLVEFTYTGALTTKGDDAFGTGRRTITSSEDVFVPSDIGRLIRHGDTEPALTQWCWMEIREYISATEVRVNVRSNMVPSGSGGAPTTGTEHWRMGAWGQDSTLGYPSVCNFFEQRLAFANTAGAPNAFWASRSSDFENLTPTINYVEGGSNVNTVNEPTDSHSLFYTLNAGRGRVDPIQWMESTRALVLATKDGIWPAQATSFLDPITPSNIQMRTGSSFGTGCADAAIVEDAIIYASTTCRVVRSLGYDFRRDSYVASDLTIDAEHITKSGVHQISWQHEPYFVVWCLRNDGELSGLTWLKEHDVRGWSRHIIGGSFLGSGGPTAVVESIAVIPAPTTAAVPHDQLWMVVKRTINGQTVRYIEFLTAPFDAESALADAWFVDSGMTRTVTGLPITGASTAASCVVLASNELIAGEKVTISGVQGMTRINGTFLVTSPTPSQFEITYLDGSAVDSLLFNAWTSGGKVYTHRFTGLDHLDGSVVQVFADGATAGTAVVSGGIAITDKAPTAGVLFGLQYGSGITSLPVVVPSPQGSSDGHIKKIDTITTRFLRTVSCELGPDQNSFDDLTFTNDALDTAPPLFTGDIQKTVLFPHSKEPQVWFRQVQPLPCTILGFFADINTSTRGGVEQ